jgi:regulator of protease activity HflC (stomatin/prohibitin superfamily)
VGTEVEHKSKLGESVFSFWSSHKAKPGSEFVTGDVASGGNTYVKVQVQSANGGTPGQKVKISTASQLLDGFVVAWWRVKNPGLFFHNVENRNIIEYGGSAGIGITPHSKPMDHVLVHQLLLAAITRVFARHSLHEILESQTPEVVSDIKSFMQKRLDAMQSGIQITNVDIKDLHPPKGLGGYRSPRTGRLIPGPARAFEEVVSAREEKHSLIQDAKMRAFQDVTIASGKAKALVSQAEAAAAKRVNAEEGRAVALKAESTAFAQAGGPARVWAFYRAIGSVFPEISKVILGPGVSPPQIWQLGHAHSRMPLAPPTAAGDVNSGLNAPNVAGAMGASPQQQ